jgi:acyl carrier protein
MDKDEILKTVNAVFIDVLNNENIVLTYETTANDVEEWDSLNHIHLVVTIEKQFGIRFSSQEIQSWNSIGELIVSIGNRVNSTV